MSCMLLDHIFLESGLTGGAFLSKKKVKKVRMEWE